MSTHNHIIQNSEIILMNIKQGRKKKMVYFWFANWPLYMEGKERMKEANHFRFVGGKFDKQGNWLKRLVLGGHKRSNLCTCCQNLRNLYRGLNWVLSCTLPRWSQLSDIPWVKMAGFSDGFDIESYSIGGNQG